MFSSSGRLVLAKLIIIVTVKVGFGIMRSFSLHTEKSLFTFLADFFIIKVVHTILFEDFIVLVYLIFMQIEVGVRRRSM